MYLDKDHHILRYVSIREGNEEEEFLAVLYTKPACPFKSHPQPGLHVRSFEFSIQKSSETRLDVSHNQDL